MTRQRGQSEEEVGHSATVDCSDAQVSEELNQALRQQFGLENFRNGQREVIQTLMAGRSAAAIFPTGGGKSLCYQLPAVLLDGLTLVVSPLMALMREQVANRLAILDPLQAKLVTHVLSSLSCRKKKVSSSPIAGSHS